MGDAGSVSSASGRAELPLLSLPPWVLVRAVLAVVLVGFSAVGLEGLLTGPARPLETVLTLGALGALVAIQILYFARPAARLRRRASLGLLGVQAALTFGLPALYGDQWADLPGLLAGSALLVLPTRWRLTAFGLVIALAVLRVHDASPPATYTSADPVIEIYATVGAVITGLVVFGLSRLAGLVVDLRDSQQEMVQAAAEDERLRLSGDLDESIGRRLVEIIMRGEVAHRRAGWPTERIQEELARILQATRDALTEARAIASRYRTLSLSSELRSVEAVLEQVGIRVSVVVDRVDLRADVETALAVALREAVTACMRAGDIRACSISLRDHGPGVRLQVREPDSADPGAAEPDCPSAVPVTRERVANLGGCVSCSPPGTRFAVVVDVPTCVPVRRAGRGRPGGTARLVTAIDEGGAAEGRTTRAIASAVLVGFLVVAAARAFPALPNAASGTGTIAGLVLITLIQVAVVRSARPARSPLHRIAWAAQAGAMALPLVVGVPFWVSLPGVVAGAAFLTWRVRLALPLSLAVVLGFVLVQARMGTPPAELVFVGVGTVNSAVTTWALAQLAWLVHAIHARRSELADYAVLTERLRVVRDVHDLLGLNLSAITLKAELAHRLLGRDDAAAEAELQEIVQIARMATDDLAAVTKGGPLASLHNELEAVRSVLRTAQIEVVEQVKALDLGPAQVEVCVAVLREGVTNMLRHSKVEHCEIVLSQDGDSGVLVQLTSDGASAGPQTDPPAPAPVIGGAGLRHLRARVCAIGGRLDAGCENNVFRLTARLPSYGVG
jgi:signal transduction histidine kinase